MKVILNAARLSTKEEAHEYISKVFDFPDYYGKNLDALADCLSEETDMTIVICNVKEAGDYLQKLIPVFRDHAILELKD